MKNQRRGHANGLIKRIDKHSFVHNCNTDKGCSGGAIVNKNNNCIIGIHKGELVNPLVKKGINVGIFIYDIINDIIEKKDLPLFLNPNLTESKIPVEYIIDSIKSKDNSFYIISNDDKFSCFALINNIKIEDDFFVIRLYSSIYYKFLNNYLLTKEINGFTEEQLKSWIYCLHLALSRNKNVAENTIVYRGIIERFPSYLGISSKFYIRSFLSTSKKRKFSEELVRHYENSTLFIIKITNNGNNCYPNYCCYIEDISYTPNQYEVIISCLCCF